MAERNTAEELDDVYEIKYSTDAMTGGADKRMYLYYQLARLTVWILLFRS